MANNRSQRPLALPSPYPRGGRDAVTPRVLRNVLRARRTDTPALKAMREACARRLRG